MLCHTGSHGEAPGSVRRQRLWGNMSKGLYFSFHEEEQVKQSKQD